MVFIGDNLLRRRCQFCKTSRFFGDDDESTNSEFFPDVLSYSGLRPRAVYEYIPLIPRLKLLYATPDYAEKMRYPNTLLENEWRDGIRDVWDGIAMRHWRAHPEGANLLEITYCRLLR